MKKDPLNRFLEKVQVGPLPVEWTGRPEDRTECLLWIASCNQKGYGSFKCKGRSTIAHRWIYERSIGPIPEGLQLDHLCRIRHCVNPLHLEPVTSKENSYRSLLYIQSRSKCGHLTGKQNGRTNGLKNRKNNLPEGVTFSGKKYIARKWDGRKTRCLGTFSTPEEASKAYQAFIKKDK